ncbi:MAG: ATP-binding protein [Olsenella sp.]|nr:ATP-binding protein [Olsenella sp.]
MQRDIIDDLRSWKVLPHRKPLMLKGARQVGKTWVLREFGAQCYENVAYVSLEQIAPGIPSEYAELFEQTHDPHRIVRNLSLALGETIDPDRTLIILDEIQDCPAAIGALKYFAEEAPEYHVSCAGSLLGVALARNEGSFPVGKVTFRELAPLSFSEFLRAVGATGLDTFCAELDEVGPLPEVFCSQLEEQLRAYFAVGGMPEAVRAYAEGEGWASVDRVLSDLLDSYERDFAKHGGSAMYAKISQVWRSLPAQLARENRKFLWGLVREGARAREYEDAVTWLENAGLLRRVVRSAGPCVPLSLHDAPSSFKAYCLDGGLLRRLAGLGPEAFGRKDQLFSQFKGAFAENYALSALMGQLEVAPRYWTSEKPRHEVDFLVQDGGAVLPVEVKSGAVVKSASLRYYARKYPDATPLRMRLSLHNLSQDEELLNVPLYLADHAMRLARLCAPA